MATAFNKNYTELTNVNSGNQLQNGDDILGEHVNVALQNTAHFKDLTNNTVIRSASILNNILTLVLATKTNTGNTTTTNLNIDISNLNGVKANQGGGGFNGIITNYGSEITLDVADSIYTYRFRVSDDGVEYIEEEYDSESGTTTTYTTNLAKYPCYIKMTRTNAEILINTVGRTGFSTVGGLTNILPINRTISATGYLTLTGFTGYLMVRGVNITASSTIIEYFYVNFSTQTVTTGSYQYATDSFTIDAVIKLF